MCGREPWAKGEIEIPEMFSHKYNSKTRLLEYYAIIRSKYQSCVIMKTNYLLHCVMKKKKRKAIGIWEQEKLKYLMLLGHKMHFSSSPGWITTVK